MLVVQKHKVMQRTAGAQDQGCNPVTLLHVPDILGECEMEKNTHANIPGIAV